MKVIKKITALIMLLDVIFSLSYFFILHLGVDDIDFDWMWLLNIAFVVVLFLLKKKMGNFFYYALFWIYILGYGILLTPIILGGNSNNNLSENIVVVLASGFNENGELSENAIIRLEESLVYKNKDTLFIVSGGQKMNGLTEAKLMKKYLIENGIDEKRIIEDNKSVDTYQSILNLVNYINENNSVVVVSSRFHIFRCKLITKCLKIENCTFMGTDSRKMLKLYYYTREIAAIIREICKNKIFTGILLTSSVYMGKLRWYKLTR